MAKKGPTGNWFNDSKNIKGFLLDISGVLYDSDAGGGKAIDGSVEAVKRLKSAGVPIRLCTNETQDTKESIAKKLNGFGFDVKAAEIFPPGPAACSILKENSQRPHLLVHKNLLPEFSSVDQNDPNCVVIGDAADEFSYSNLNAAFRILVDMKNPTLYSLGRGKYYKTGEGLMLDVGAFMKGLEYACDLEAIVVGKPSSAFFGAILKDMGLEAKDAVMVGDDIVNDCGGAQACGMKGLQVRTGKYRPQDEPHSTVNPDGYVDNLAQAVELFLKHR